MKTEILAGELIEHRFIDGIFSWPSKCGNGKCKNRMFELRRETAEAIDYQTVKVCKHLASQGECMIQPF